MHRERTILAAVMVISLGLCRAACGQAQNPSTEDPDWVKPLAAKRIVYSVPGMDQVKVQKDVAYKRVDGSDLRMDVYSPRGEPNARRAAVVLIHGGPIPANLRTGPKDWGSFVSTGQLVAASGFVGVTFNHRFHSWENLNQPQGDVADLIIHVRDHADSLGIDRDRIVVWAFSGGGPFLSGFLRDRPAYLRCIVSYYAVMDLPETLREHSPVYHVGRAGSGTPPIFIARAGLDGPEINAGLDRFVQAALSKNVTIDLSNHSEGHHGFDIYDDNERSRQIIKRTVEFIKAHP